MLVRHDAVWWLVLTHAPGDDSPYRVTSVNSGKQILLIVVKRLHQNRPTNTGLAQNGTHIVFGMAATFGFDVC